MQEELLQYNGSYASSGALEVNVPEVVVLPADNVNGIIINRMICTNFQGWLSVIAKSTPPTTLFQGDVLFVSDPSVPSVSPMTRENTKIKVPAGKGIYVIANGAQNGGAMRAILYTKL